MANAAVPYPSTVQTATGYGDTTGSGTSEAFAMAVDPLTGITYMAGPCSGTLPLGTLPPLVCSGGTFILKTAADGTPLKAVSFSLPGLDVVDLVLSPDAQALYIGSLGGSYRKYDADTLEQMWSNTITVTGPFSGFEMKGMAVDSQGDLVLAGYVTVSTFDGILRARGRGRHSMDTVIGSPCVPHASFSPPLNSR